MLSCSGDLGGRHSSWFYQWHADWPWVAYLTSLRLGCPTSKTRIWTDWYLLALIFCVCIVISKVVYEAFSLSFSVWTNWVGHRWPGEKQRESCPLPLAVNQQWLLFSSHCPFTPTCVWSVHSLCPSVSFAVSAVTSVQRTPTSFKRPPQVHEQSLCSVFYLNSPQDCRQWVPPTDQASQYLSEAATFTVPVLGIIWGWGTWGFQRLNYLTKAAPGNRGLTGIWTQAGPMTQSCICQTPQWADSLRLHGSGRVATS